jgi:hypothetical protein
MEKENNYLKNHTYTKILEKGKTSQKSTKTVSKSFSGLQKSGFDQHRTS